MTSDKVPHDQNSVASEGSLLRLSGGDEQQSPARFGASVRLTVPTRTLPLVCLLLAFGAVGLTFTYVTVHRRTAADIAPNSGRPNFSVGHWIDHGYFQSGGLLVRPSGTPPGYNFYVSSTGGHLVSGFLVEKTYKALTGHTSIRLLAFHNQVVTLLVAVVIGLLGFRLARRIGVRPLHALILAGGVELVHFTFPDNLAMFWELSGRQPFLFFATLFLLIEERSEDRRTRLMTIAQGIAAFLMTYMEYVAGSAFLGSYLVVSAVLRPHCLSAKRTIAITILPMLLAVGVFAGQRAWVHAKYPDTPTSGSKFLFRTGLDGSSQYYGDHLDIAYRRDLARLNFPQNREHLFRWKWLFWAGTAAFVAVLILGAYGRVPLIALTSLLSLVGSYVLYAALFSQAVVIHPYYYDVLLFTPLVLALLVVAPALLESTKQQSGIFVVAVFFVAAWLCMVQLRAYSMRYPPPPIPSETAAPR